MRQTFIDTTIKLLDEDPRAALVIAEISAEPMAKAFADHPERAFNVGIREQLMIGVAGGLALTGLRPIAHSYATFLVDRAYEQIKLDLGHQGAGAILVEPYLEGTSAHLGRFDSIGVKRVDLHRYGSPKDHARWHGLDPASLRARLLTM